MTFDAKAEHFNASEFLAYVKTKTWTSGWRPKFITLHNSSEPSLEQWLKGGATPAERMENLKVYYRDQLHWHSGPHLFIAPDGIWELCDLEHDGVHASCFNHSSIGIEMVGEYDTESFNDGPGLQVQQLALAALAALHVALNLNPVPYAIGQTGLHFHKECLADDHLYCPGKNVDKGILIAKLQNSIAALRASNAYADHIANLTVQTYDPDPAPNAKLAASIPGEQTNALLRSAVAAAVAPGALAAGGASERAASDLAPVSPVQNQPITQPPDLRAVASELASPAAPSDPTPEPSQPTVKNPFAIPATVAPVIQPSLDLPPVQVPTATKNPFALPTTGAPVPIPKVTPVRPPWLTEVGHVVEEAFEVVDNALHDLTGR